MSDESSFVALVRAEYRGVVAASMMITGSSAVAEEIVQDVFERTYVRWKKVSQLDRPGAWVRRAVLNQSISATRRKASERRALTMLIAGDPRGRFVEDRISEVGETLWSAVAGLPSNQATAIALHYGADLSIAAVSDEMGLSEQAVKTLLYRARCTLRESAQVKEIHR